MTEISLPRQGQYTPGVQDMPRLLLHDPVALGQMLAQMLEHDQQVYTQARERLFGDELLGDLEALDLRLMLPVLKGRMQAVAEALGLADPTSPAGRL